MTYRLVILLYNLALPLLFIVAFPAWLLKMYRRGGYGTGLLERITYFKKPPEDETQGGLYIHAVSVGEVLIAARLIRAIREKHPELPIVLAATTSTGHAIARELNIPFLRVIYAPIDFPFTVRRTLKRFSPSQMILIEAEAWPNLLRIARKMTIPITMANARLSPRSEARFAKVAAMVRPLFAMIDHLCVQQKEDAERFKNLGVAPTNIHLTGSIKFDSSGASAPQKRDEFQAQLDHFGSNRPVILISSTHAGEEKLIAEAIQPSHPECLLLVVPRHAERRNEVCSDLASVGLTPILRTQFEPPSDPASACLVADTTGELRDWTAHADLCIIGKSWLGYGGQNPAEAIAASVPVICGPHMENFQSLVAQLVTAGGVIQLDSPEQLADSVSSLLSDASRRETITNCAQEVLSGHLGAINRTLEVLEL